MDPGQIAVLIPIVAIICGTVVKVASTYRSTHQPPAGGDANPRLEALEEELAAMRQELSEAQERLDFTERLLARGKPPDNPGRSD